AAVGGVDIIKDDELLSETSYNNRIKRIEMYMQMAKKADRIKGEKTLYAVNITDRADRLLDNALDAINAGANALMVNYLTQGISDMRCLAENPKINVPILAHLDFSGVLYANAYGGMSSHLVLGKLARLAGADMIVYPIESGKYRLLDEKYRQIAYDLVLPWQNIKSTLPIPAGGLSANLVPKVLYDLGFDCAISAGGAIHGHPMGAIAGAKALRQAIDAVVAGLDINEYAENHKELKAALEKWS
ncbi:MAG: ribulose 1,5-bisphosphate carboxylase, partial [Actinobacteria bacterium]|nr:ribulose 1,5-bisphosphate carboxylase [Actinomycetota bacterium]